MVIKYLFGQGDALSDFLTKNGYLPTSVMFFIFGMTLFIF